MMTYLFVPNMTAKAEEVSVAGVPAKIKVGEKFTVSITVPKNIGGSVYVEYDNAKLKVVSCPASDVGTGLTSYTAFFNSSTETVEFEATVAGTATVSVYMTDAEYSDVDPSVSLPTIAKVTKTVEIVNEVAPEAPPKSDDNSLVSLKLSSGSTAIALSPSFKGNVTNYTATVDYNISQVVVSAERSNKNAIVTGGGTVNLKVGKNTIQIVVKAENGISATYTVVVTRKAQETQPSENPSQSEPIVPEVNELLQWNGEQLQPASKIPTESIPESFESQLLVVNGQQMQGLSFTKGDLKVLYLNNTNGAGSLYVYDEEKETIYPFIKLTSEKSYVMVLLPDEQNAPAPEGFESCTFSIEGKGIVSAYQWKEDVEDANVSWNLFGAETFYAAPAKGNEFYLIYCMNGDGEKGWYMYDSVEETFQRYFATASSMQVGGNPSEDIESGDSYAELEKELNAAKKTQYIIIAVAAAIIVILIVLLVVLCLKNRSNEDDGYWDDVDDVEEDDEIEIEFYNMEEAIVEQTEKTEETEQAVESEKAEQTAKVDSKNEENDDENDLEFIDFE